MRKSILVLFLLFCLSSCSVSSDSNVESSKGFVTDNSFLLDKNESTGNSKLEFGEKISYTINIDLVSNNVKESSVKLENSLLNYDGIIVNSNVYSNKVNNSARYEIKVPSLKYQAFIDSLDTIGEIVYENKSQVDLTSQYIDVTSRLTNLVAQEKRLVELLDTATTLNDILQIENQLNNVRYQIDNYTSQKEYIDSRVDYTTVYVNISEDYTIIDKILDNTKNIFENIIVFSPYLVLIGLTGLVVFVLKKNKRKMNGEKNEKK